MLLNNPGISGIMKPDKNTLSYVDVRMEKAYDDRKGLQNAGGGST